MAGLAGLAAHRRWIYAGGLLVIGGVRLTPLAGPASIGAITLVIAIMGLTYAGEHVADGGAVRTVPLLVGLAGVAAGTAVALTGRAVGLVFVAGGLLFLRRAGEGASRRSSDGDAGGETT